MRLNRIAHKLLLVCLSFCLPIGVMLTLMVRAKQKDIDFALWETKGNRLQRPLANMLEQVSRHRWLALRLRAGESELAGAVEATAAAARQALAQIDRVMQSEGVDLQFTPDGLGKRQREDFTAERLAAKWSAVEAGSLDGERMDALHQDLVVHLRTMITHAGDTSNLILDPDLDSYYLMDVTLLALPQMQDRLQSIAVFLERLGQRGAITDQDRLDLRVFAAFLKEADLDRIRASSQTSLNEDPNFYGASPTLAANLSRGLEANAAAGQRVVDDLMDLARAARIDPVAFARIRQNLDAAISAAYSYGNVGFDELDLLLAIRLETFRGGIWNAVVYTSLSLLASALLAGAIAFSLTRRVRAFIATTTTIARGDLTARNNMTSGDEIGELARSFDAMTDELGKLNEQIASKNRILARDFELLGAVQSLLLPRDSHFEAPGLVGSGFYQPAAQCGGDWWWYEIDDDGCVTIVLGDVSGHGAGPAMISSAVASTFRTLRTHDVTLGPASILRELDRCVGAFGGQFHMTMSIAQIDPFRRQLRWSNAAGPVAFVQRGSQLQILTAAGSVLGGLEALEVGEMVVPFNPGDRLLICTDGVLELKRQDGRDLGAKQVSRMLSGLRREPLDGACTRFASDLNAMLGDRTQNDDITFVMVEATPLMCEFDLPKPEAQLGVTAEASCLA